MTRISYDAGSYTLTASGHAGAGARGEDLICAGVSTLMFTLEAVVMANREAMMPTVVHRDGEITVRCMPGKGARRRCRQIYETIYTGLQMLSEQYPAYVQTRTEEEDR